MRNTLSIPPSPEALRNLFIQLAKIIAPQAKKMEPDAFVYCGDVDDFSSYGFPCGKVGRWRFISAVGEVCLDAVCNGALYSWCLEIHPDFDKLGFFEARLREAKRAVKRVIESQNYRASQTARQLSLFEN